MARNSGYDEVSTKIKIKENYDRVSRFYDWFSLFEASIKYRGLDILNAQLGEHVLEIGCGTGSLLSHLAKRVGEEGAVAGLDVSDGMICSAQKKLRRLEGQHRIELIRGDAEALPFSDGAFDAIFTSFTLELFDAPGIDSVLSECQRVLKQNGRLCVVAMAAREPANRWSRLYAWLHEKYPRVIDCRPIHLMELIGSGSFLVDLVEHTAVFGLPVDIVLARSER